MGRLLDRVRGLWAFALAASAAPTAYVISMPCGAACLSCPLTGACLLTTPLVILLVLVAKFSRKIASGLSRF